MSVTWPYCGNPQTRLSTVPASNGRLFKRMDVWGSTSGAFLLAFSALISIVNPIGGALIYNQVTGGRSADERRRLARKIAIYALIVMLTALWAGASVISFFGISLAALRIAGGFAVAAQAWQLLSAPQENED